MSGSLFHFMTPFDTRRVAMWSTHGVPKVGVAGEQEAEVERWRYSSFLRTIGIGVPARWLVRLLTCMLAGWQTRIDIHGEPGRGLLYFYLYFSRTAFLHELLLV